MQPTRQIPLALLVLTSACASNAEEWKRPVAPNAPLRGGIAELQVTSYDGENIKGRVLIGATIDSLVLDRRLAYPGDLDIVLKSVRACGKKDWIPYVRILDSVLSPRSDVSITVRPGYWYGKTATIWLFTEKLTGLGPDCIEAELLVRALDEREIARIPIRAVRTDKPPPPTNGEAPSSPSAPAPPTPDAGAP